MQHGEEANLRAQVLGIRSYSAQGFGRGLKENVVYHLLVLVSDRGNLIRDGEDDMEILAVEKLRLAVAAARRSRLQPPMSTTTPR